ncbi:SubName: Full=Uncharacterized protein {ECO:0000313/EMBL:CCA75085.1} [Serendipita indica DSM 11827]|nr:SubName: Full=Uncharacterized protein {ECO:0000313/EMBL:CCA75085.1} [Serendipita indica DSM 11827]
MNGRQATAQGLGNPNQLLPVNGGMVQPTAPGGPPQPSQMAYGGGYVPQPMPQGVMTRLVPGPGGLPGPPSAQPLYYQAGPGVARPMVAGPGQLQHMQGVPPPMNAGAQPPGGPQVRYAPHPQAMGRGMPGPMPGMQRPPQPGSYPMGIPMASMPPGMRAFRGPQSMQPGTSVMTMGGPPGPHSMAGQPVMLPPGYGPPPGGMPPQGQPVMIQQSPRKQPGPMTASSPRNASPHAGNASTVATPASAGTPGSRMARAPTPTGRPGTATQPPQSQTPRMQHVDLQNSVQPSPQALHRVASMPSMSMTGPPPPGGVNPAYFRTTPAQAVGDQQMNPQPTMGPGAQGPMDGVRYTSLPPHPGASGPVSMQPQMQPGPRMVPGHLGQPTPLQPQLTGDAQPLISQHTGGSLGGPPPLTPQHTGGAGYPQGSSGVGGQPPPPQPTTAARSSATSTPNIRPQSTAPHSANEAMDEVSTITEMNFQSIHGGSPNLRLQFGTMRLLQFSKAINSNKDPRSIPGRDESYWPRLLADHFTEDASLRIRVQDPSKPSTNAFVRLPYGLLIRFFTTLSQSEIYRMSLNLDGPAETQDNYVTCQTARWPMHYSNGYIIELVGQLRAKCKTVPMLPQRPPDDSSPELEAGRAPIPYMVKIEEMIFDSAYSSKYIDIDLLRQQAYGYDPKTARADAPPAECKIPEEPPNSHGLPSMAMRMVEFAEGMHALVPIIQHEGNFHIPPSHAMRELAQSVMMDHHSFMHTMAYSVPLPEGSEGYVSASDPTIGFGHFPKKEDPYMDLASASTSNNAMSNSTHSTPNQKPTAAGAGASTAAGAAAGASVSPTISSKPPSGKKGGTAPGSPTKASAAEKEKASTKRKNTIDTNPDGPPNKRSRVTRKPSRGM